MNIHLKIWDENMPNSMMEQIVSLIRQSDCEKHIYFTTTNNEMIKELKQYAPDLKVCLGWDVNYDHSVRAQGQHLFVLDKMIPTLIIILFSARSSSTTHLIVRCSVSSPRKYFTTKTLKIVAFRRLSSLFVLTL